MGKKLENDLEIKTKLLETAPKAKNLAQLSKLAGVPRNTMYRHLDKDPALKADIDRLLGMDLGKKDREKLKAKKAKKKGQGTEANSEEQASGQEGEKAGKGSIGKEVEKHAEYRTVVVRVPLRGSADRTQRRFTPEQRVEFGEAVCKLVENGASVRSACEAVGIEHVYFYRWINPLSSLYIVDLKDRYDEAKKVYEDSFKEEVAVLAKRAMVNLLTDRKVTSVTKTGIVAPDGKVTIGAVSQREDTREASPHIVRMVAESLLPDFLSEDRRAGIAGADADVYYLKGMSEDQLEAELQNTKRRLAAGE